MDGSEKVLPEFEVDYTPLLTIPYDKLPLDLKMWEKRDSWLLDTETREKVKKAKGTMVAKSLEKEEKRASIIWRVSLNSAPLIEKLVNHFHKVEPKCNIKKVLRLIKDIKNVALKEDEKDFLKSYNVKQALLWCLHENPKISTEKEILLMTLQKITEFYKNRELFSFLEPKRNLIYKMAMSGMCENAHKKVRSIIQEIDTHLDKIKDLQETKKEGVQALSNIIAPTANLLQFFTMNLAQTAAKGLSKGLFLYDKDGIQRFYFKENDERLEDVLKKLFDASLKYFTDKNISSGGSEKLKQENEDEMMLEKKAIEMSLECHTSDKESALSDLDLD